MQFSSGSLLLQTHFDTPNAFDLLAYVLSTMELFGAIYYTSNSSSKYHNLQCRRSKYLQKGFRCGFELFLSETKQQLVRENPGRHFSFIRHLASNAWNELALNGKFEYDRRARESRPIGRMNERCPGRLKMLNVNGLTVTGEDGLVSYVPHNEELSVVFR